MDSLLGLPVSNSSASCVQSKVAKISVPLMHNVEEGDLDANWKLKEPSDPITTRSLLCLSNGHGEDSIAASILTQILVRHLLFSSWGSLFEISENGGLGICIFIV